jgi:hypothetical protein
VHEFSVITGGCSGRFRLVSGHAQLHYHSHEP